MGTDILVTYWQLPIEPNPMAERPKAKVWGRSLAGIPASNPAKGMHVNLLTLLCVVR